MMLFELFKTFFIIGCISFGGGYATIPIIEMEVTAHQWMTTEEFTDIIGIAGTSPGPIATNCAVFVGYQTAGFAGAVASTLGVVLPSFIVILILAAFFYRANKNPIVQSAFYGLRPIVVGLVVYAAIKFAFSSGMVTTLSNESFSLLLIFIFSLLALTKFHLHPAVVIILSGLAGVALYT